MSTYRANLFKGLTEEKRTARSPRRSVIGLSAEEIVQGAGVNDVDVLIGGPNCQAVSTGGVRNPGDRRNRMFWQYVRLVEELRPRWFVIENVPGLTHRNNLPLLRVILERLCAIRGYRVAADVLLAAEYGVPQLRYRLFIVGTRTGEVVFPEPRFFSDRDPRFRTVEEAIADLADVAADGEIVPNHVAFRPAALNLRRIRHVPQGGDWRDIPIELLPERNFATRTSDQKGTYGRLRWDAPAFTITGLFANVTAGPFTHPIKHRPLTAREAARLQGINDGFVFEGPLPSWGRQIGNLVPPPMARAVAQTILAAEAGSFAHAHAGRLTLEVIRAAERGDRSLPVLTPRFAPAVSPRRRTFNGTTVSAKPRARTARPSVRRLREEAKLPSWTWTAKRARAILAHRDGAPPATIAQKLRLAVSTVRRWVIGYGAAGADGWRAYHTSLADIAEGDGAKLRKLRAAVEQVRAFEHTRRDGARPHMNRYLARLVDLYGNSSVRELIRLAAREHRVLIGTAYVGDLLAIVHALKGLRPKQAA